MCETTYFDRESVLLWLGNYLKLKILFNLPKIQIIIHIIKLFFMYILLNLLKKYKFYYNVVILTQKICEKSVDVTLVTSKIAKTITFVTNPCTSYKY